MIPDHFLNKALWALCKPLFLTLPLKHLETLWCVSTYPSHSHGSVERDAPSWLKLPHLSDAWFLDDVYLYHFPSLRTSVTTFATFSKNLSPMGLSLPNPKTFLPPTNSSIETHARYKRVFLRAVSPGHCSLSPSPCWRQVSQAPVVQAIKATTAWTGPKRTSKSSAPVPSISGSR